MNPLTLRIAAVLAGAALAFSAGWVVNGWRLKAEIAAIKTEQSEGRASQAKAALEDLAAAAKNIKTAATGHQTDISAINAALAAIRKDIKNAKPLPPDCRPDDVRVRALEAAVDAINKAGVGQQPSRAMPRTE